MSTPTLSTAEIIEELKYCVWQLSQYANDSINAQLFDDCNDMYKLIEKLERHLVVKGK